MRINGKSSHSEATPRAGHRKPASGKDGVRKWVPGSFVDRTLAPLTTRLGFRRGLCGDGEGAAIVTGFSVDIGGEAASIAGLTPTIAIWRELCRTSCGELWSLRRDGQGYGFNWLRCSAGC